MLLEFRGMKNWTLALPTYCINHWISFCWDGIIKINAWDGFRLWNWQKRNLSFLVVFDLALFCDLMRLAFQICHVLQLNFGLNDRFWYPLGFCWWALFRWAGRRFLYQFHRNRETGHLLRRFHNSAEATMVLHFGTLYDSGIWRRCVRLDLITTEF